MGNAKLGGGSIFSIFIKIFKQACDSETEYSNSKYLKIYS